MTSAKPATGRDVSARITRRLRDALSSGLALSRAELALRAGCTTRTVHNYLAQSEKVLGLRIKREVGPDRVAKFVADDGGVATTIEQLGQALASEMLRRVFPVEGTRFERRAAAGPQLVVSVRGTFSYEERHLRVLRRWLQAASSKPRRALRFVYRNGEERIIWPLGIVVRDLARVYLAGVPMKAARGSDIRTFALERVKVESPVTFASAGKPPPGIDSARITDAIDDPFSMFPPTEDAVHARVRFPQEQAMYVIGRRWHQHQKMKRRLDGSVDIEFGPADLHEAAAWVRQWGSGVQVLGDRRLREAVGAPAPKKKRDPRPRGWPSRETRAFMKEKYGRLLSWDEYCARADRFVTDAREIYYDEDGIMVLG